MSAPRRGKSISMQAFIETLLPFQGAIAAANLPRALPWAMRLLGLQPAHKTLVNYKCTLAKLELNLHIKSIIERKVIPLQR